jgi:hypothetical protein
MVHSESLTWKVQRGGQQLCVLTRLLCYSNGDVIHSAVGLAGHSSVTAARRETTAVVAADGDPKGHLSDV